MGDEKKPEKAVPGRLLSREAISVKSFDIERVFHLVYVFICHIFNAKAKILPARRRMWAEGLRNGSWSLGGWYNNPRYHRHWSIVGQPLRFIPTVFLFFCPVWLSRAICSNQSD